MFLIKSNTLGPLYASENMSFVKKRLKEFVHEIRGNYMELGHVYANYYNCRNDVEIIFVPYNQINNIEKHLMTLNIIEIL